MVQTETTIPQKRVTAAESKITNRDISEGTVLRDNVYDAKVKLVCVDVGKVYLRYFCYPL